ncbi:MAG: hypothetical protein IPM35_11820 [Myxococcales bacterium]|nr:hypothetical protein [Myxococcales bacterium]
MQSLLRSAVVGCLVVVAAAAVGCASGESSGAAAIGGGTSIGGSGTGASGGTGGTGGSSVGGAAGTDGGAGTGGGWPGECSGAAEQPCYGGPAGTEGVGECKAGKQVCENGKWSACQGEVIPADETCDKRDNDCDGLEDEDQGQTTCGKGVCQVTVENCVAGVAQTCTPKQGSATEQCDGTDDNCDGQVDEGCSCTNGQTQACYTGAPATKNVGECSAGTQTCSGGKWGTCSGEQLPVAEKCNGLDDDCDGQTDEGNPQGGQTCSTGKQGACGAGTTACQNSTLVCNQNVQPSAEICDGVDNNCNGSADEGNPGSGQTCSTGKLGVCSAGTTQCQSGGIVCAQNVQPSTETCDGVDNNCNGNVDEGCNCLNGTTQGCYTGAPGTQGVGQCKAGTQTCTNGNWGACTGQVIPTTETCNAKDDNCNGSTDENNPGGGGGCTTGLPGICSAGSYQCQGGSLQCVQSQQPAPSDTCGNNQDDNCNGQVDENCGCAHDVCSTGVKLTSGCDAATGNCVSKVCAVDSFCCNQDWDSLCVMEVRTVCKSLKCSESQGSCSHTLCTTGTALVNNCDSAKANCVNQICAVDSYCCTNFWDSYCVSEVASVCANGHNCL